MNDLFLFEQKCGKCSAIGTFAGDDRAEPGPLRGEATCGNCGSCIHLKYPPIDMRTPMPGSLE